MQSLDMEPTMQLRCLIMVVGVILTGKDFFKKISQTFLLFIPETQF